MNECFFTFSVAPCHLFHRIGFLGHKGSFWGWVVFFLFIALSPTMDVGMHYPGPSRIAVGRWPSTLSPLRDVPRAKSCLAQGHAHLGVAHTRWLENKGLVILAQFGMMQKEHPSSRVPHGVAKAGVGVYMASRFCPALHPSPPFYRCSSPRLSSLLQSSLSGSASPRAQPATSSVPAIWGH